MPWRELRGDQTHAPYLARPALDRRIERLREIARSDQRLDGVLLYGSWTLGEADAHSDIEAYLYVRDVHADGFDGREFIERLAPLKLAYTNMYGIPAVVFGDLMRGEFHVEPAGPGIEEVPSWRGQVHLPDPGAAVLLDRSGRLTAAARRLADFRPPEPVPRPSSSPTNSPTGPSCLPTCWPAVRPPGPTPCCTASSSRSNCSRAGCCATPRRTGSRPAGPSKTTCPCPTATVAPPPPPLRTRRRCAQRHSGTAQLAVEP